MLTKTPGIIYKRIFSNGHFTPESSEFEVCILGLNNLGTYVVGFGRKNRDTGAFEIWTSTSMLKYEPDGVELGSDEVVFWSLHEPGFTDALDPQFIVAKIEGGSDIQELEKLVSEYVMKVVTNPESPINEIPEIGF